MFHRDQPSLERPGISYLGRSIYATFGLEGVNDGLETTERAELLDYFVAALIDEPTATISDTTVDNASGLTRFKANFLSSTDATPVGYRWDFGDGSDYTVSFPNADASHTYTYCGTYTVRVEVEDWWGNYVVGTQKVKVDNCLEGWVLYLPVALRD
ncbi:MAG: PKD domain-containing protein, partial [Actinobacteria bacterium]|nr:PKD domain-containing protein [Actinomycetota bacterium]